MLTLALKAMHSKWYAIILVVLSGCFPIFFWLNITLTGCIILRKGTKGISIIPWSILPYLVHLWLNNHNINYVILTAILLTTVCGAFVLRATLSWSFTLLSLIPAGLLLLVAFKLVLSGSFDFFYQQINLMSEAIFLTLKNNPSIKELPIEINNEISINIIVGLLQMLIVILSSGCLLLARSWQSSLYNPGGFKKEFYQIRIQQIIILIFILTLFAIRFDYKFIILSCMLTAPFFIAGISLFHRFCVSFKYKKTLLIIFYLCTALLIQIMYPLLVLTACLDSVFDLRHKLSKKFIMFNL